MGSGFVLFQLDEPDPCGRSRRVEHRYVLLPLEHYRVVFAGFVRPQCLENCVPHLKVEAANSMLATDLVSGKVPKQVRNHLL